MASKQDWLDAGLEILAEHGAPGLTIDRLVGMLGLTKGSFYHHFGGMPGFKTALLEHFEIEFTTRYIDVAEEGEAAPRLRLDRLLKLVLADKRPDAEVAVRAWSMQDEEAGQVQRRIDRSRMDYLRSLWQAHSGDAAEAKLMSQLLYFILIGASHVIPPVEGRSLKRLYDFAMDDLPARARKV